MDHAALITKTRRLVNETSAGRWADADITAELNNALYEAETRISAVAPAEFLRGAQIDLAQDVVLYERPTYEPLRTVRIKDTATGRYKDIDKLEVEQLQDHVSGAANRSQDRTLYGYALIGKYILIRPAPGAAVVAGLAVLWWEKVGLVATTDAPRMPVALHHLLAYRAADLLLDDSKDVDDAARDRLVRRWDHYFGESEEARRRLFRDHYYDRQAHVFTPEIAWAT